MDPISAGVGHADAADSEVAGRRAAAEAAEPVPDATIAYVFCSSEYEYEAVLAGVDSAVDATVVGCSTAGEIANTGSHTESVAVMVLGGEGIGPASVGIGHYDEGDRAAGRTAATNALEGFGQEPLPSVVHGRGARGWQSFPNVVGTALGAIFPDRAEVVGGVTDVADPIPFHGGWAADDWKYEDLDAVFSGRRTYGSSVLFAALHVDVRTGLGVAHGLDATDEQFTITGIEGNEVTEIDGRAALEAYTDRFGPQMGTDQALITRPVGADLGTENRRVVVPYEANQDTGALKFAGVSNLTEGMTVNVMNPTPEGVHRGARKAIDRALADAGDPDDVAAVVLHDCLCRWFHLSDTEAREEELDIVRERVGEDVPIVGWYTAGEIAYPDPRGGVHDQTLVASVISNEPL